MKKIYKRNTKTGMILKRKTTNAAKQMLYSMMWREEVPSKYKKV